MDVLLRPMTMDDYDAALALWQNCEGIGLSAADEREPISFYLERNPCLSFVAERNGDIVGTVLGGHDGRRGYLHHLAVVSTVRRNRIGQRLTNAALATLHAVGIEKCHLFVYGGNQNGKAFWQAAQWQERLDLVIFSKDTQLK